MAKRFILSGLAVMAAWMAGDFVIHGVILGPTYAATPHLWRPQAEMQGLFYLLVISVAVVAFAFCGMYAGWGGAKGLGSGLKFGGLFGLAMGTSMALGSYASTPIPASLAATWFAGTLVEGLVAGAIVGAIIRPTGGKT
jgi:hypothetical protein